jgi:hypothetical protein
VNDDKTPKKPTHDLKVVLNDGTTGTTGAGWQNEDGSVSIQLDPCVVLDRRDVRHLTLFVRGQWKGKKPI